MRLASWFVLGVVALSAAVSAAVGAGGVWGGQYVDSPVGLLLFGFLGLAAQGDPGSAIDRLTEKVERLAAGEYDVNVATDRNDDVGRLYDAVGELASALQDREQELRRNERRFQAIFDDPQMLVGVLEPDGTHLKSNETAMAYIDADEEDIAGDPFWETPWWTGHEEAQATIREKIERAATGEYVGYEGTLTDPDADQYSVEGTVRPITDEDGEVVSLIVSARDVTERREREREARRYERMVNAMRESACIYDEEGRFEVVNESLTEFYDTTREALEGRESNLIPQIRKERGDDLYQELIDGARDEIRGEIEHDFPVHGHAVLEYRLTRLTVDGEFDGIVGVTRDITERKESERELRETKRRLELALKGTNTGVWEWDLETDAVSWNRTFERLMGLEPGTFEGTYGAFKRRVHPDDWPHVKRAIEQAVENGEVFQTEFRLQHEDGDWIWVGARGRLVSDEDGGRRMIGINNDITERKRREQQLHEREQELQRYKDYTDDVLNAIDDVFYVLDEDGNLQRWNQSLIEATGYGDEDVAEMHALDFFAEEYQELIAGKIEEVFETGGTRSTRTEAPFLAKDGESIPFEFVAVALEDPEGDPVLAGIGRDISERVEKERQFSRLISNIPGLVYRVENAPGWPTEFVSEGIREITGYDPETVERGEVTWDDITAGRHEQIWDEVQAALDGRESFHLVFPIETADGEQRWVKEQGRGVYADDGSVEALEGVIIDITERIEYEREQERAQRLLEQSQQLARVGAWEIQVDEGEPADLIITDEAYQIHDLPPDADVTLEEAFGYYHPEDEGRIRDGVERAIHDGEGYDYEARLITAEGNERWIRTIADPIREDGEIVAVRGAIQDITERKRREEDLERTTDLLEQAGRLASVGGWEVDFRSDPPEVNWTDELYRIHDLPVGTDVDIEKSVELFHPEDRKRMHEVNRDLRERLESYDVELRLHNPDGKQKWVRAIGEPVCEDGERTKLRGTVQDITEKKERELTLESLHEMTQELLGTETEEAVADLVVETAEDVLGGSGVGVYLLDAESNRLEPAAFTPRYLERCGGTPSAAARDSVLWDAFLTETVQMTDDLQVFGEDVEGGLVVPIGTHGVFVVAADQNGQLPSVDEARQLIETLVATTEAALDRLESEASLRERDAELEAQNRRLRRQIQITDIIRRLDQSLIGAGSREKIETAVCERLTEAEGITFAWIGAYDASGTELVPQAWAGSGEEYLDAVALDEPGSEADPAVTAARSEEPTVVANVVDELKTEAWRKRALAHDFHSAVSVPLSFDEYFYGVLTVYADKPDAFGDLERTVFAELGENIANSINAVEAQQALHTDTAVELTLQFDEPDAFLAQVARETGTTVEYDGLATHDDGARLFFTTGGDPAAVEAVLDDLVSVTDYRQVSESDGRSLFEATVTGEVVASRLVRHGGSPRSIRATTAGLEVVVEVPATTDVREFVEMVHERHPSVELVGRRDVQGDDSPGRQRTASLLEPLTDRQREVLRTAYFAGFFEWPRESTGEDVAEILDISQPTVNRHLRLSQQQLFEQLFGETRADTSS